MGDVGKLARSGSIASDLKSVFPVISTRRTKVFAYGFVIAFVACTALLAFSPSGNASPWFNTLFTSSSSSSSSISTSIAPYRSQFSSLVFFFFPNSSSPSTESPILSRKPNNQTEMGVGSWGIGVPVGDQKGKGVGSQKDWMSGGIGSRGHGVSEKNQTEKEVGSGGNVVSENNRAEERVGSEKSGVSAGKNQTASGNGLQGTGFSVKNHTGNGVGFGENGVSAKNKKGGNGSDSSAVIVGKNQAVSGNGLQGTGVPAKNRPGKTEPESSAVLVGKNQTVGRNGSQGSGVSAKNPTGGNGSGNSAVLAEKNKTGSAIGLQGSGIPVAAKSQSGKGVSANNQKDPKSGAQQDGDLAKSQTAKGAAVGLTKSETLAADHKGITGAGRVSDSTASPMKPKGSSASASNSDGRERVEWIDRLIGCDIFQGRWVQDESYPLYPQGSCPHIDEPFDCYHNGRPDRAYQKLRWQPNGCNIPRLNATDMLERLRGKRLVFVGDSLNRNMWESLVCVLRNSVKDTRKVFEASGRHEFKTEGSYSFLFTDYSCTVEFFRSPFLVQEWEMPGNNGTTKETLRLDIVESSALKYKDAHVIVFNTGHWWTHEKTAKGRDYYQEGNHIYSELNVAEAFHKALNTWAKWVDTNVNPKKSLVFFRGYSASHFSGGRWNSGGQCHRETEPIKNEMYLSSYPPKMSILETVIKGMKTHVSYLNITRMTDYRKDAHPSIYRKQNLTDEERRSPEMYQDCSHWCLPGVPDSWNELLYAQLLIKQHQMLL